MKIALVTKSPRRIDTDLLAVGVRSAKIEEGSVLADLDEALEGRLAIAIATEGFTAADGQSLRLAGAKGIAAKTLVVFGLGKKPSDDESRMLAMRAVQAAKTHTRVAVVLPESNEEAVRRAAEGALSGAYRYGVYKTGDRRPKHGVTSVELVVSRRTKAYEAAIQEARAVQDAVSLARDLVNAPPNDMHPVALADAAVKAARTAKLTATVWNKKRLERERMDLFLAVNRASAIEPRMVHIAYKPARAKKRVVFVGKGLTFDSGGLCIKPAGSMVTMKCDMAGAATTLGIVVAAAKLKLPVEVHAILGAAENMLGPDAYRPGDVITSREGKTVEIINTDAEGRLVLADVLAWATTLEPDYLIDHATLTGACMVALGPTTAGFFANDEALGKAYMEAAKEEGESYWHMPLLDELRSQLDSDIADLKHTGGSYGGSITAALFLREFVGKTKWAHVDIAGPAFLERPFARHPKGGTGFGIATAIRFLRSLA